MKTEQKIAVIGLGNIGKAVAEKEIRTAVLKQQVEILPKYKK